ncbi:MAG: hypothetical protein K0S47_3959 [Herbinix sp.]|jgi:hypothetical protein|nr:hypothetical protein [Herbinix sp.]
MKRSNLSIQQKKASMDLNIIIIVTFVVLMGFSGIQSYVNEFVRDSQYPILLRTLPIALLQFGVAGLGITVVSIARKENLFGYGLRREGALKAILFSIPVFIPYIVFTIATGQFEGYLPFQSVWMMEDLLTSTLPIKILGIGMIAIAWGFFEGYNYVVISEKINTRLPVKYKWLNWGAIICAIMCILIHGVIGVTPENIIETISVFIIIYGMLMVKEFTGNSWGCVFLFVFFWNAF